VDAAAICRVIAKMICMPGWKVDAEPHDRFDNVVKVQVTYPTFNFNRDQAPNYKEKLELSPAFPIIADECGNEIDVHRKITQIVATIWEHEWREAWRDRLTHDAPLHPHRLDGMRAWGNPAADLAFGVI